MNTVKTSIDSDNQLVNVSVEWTREAGDNSSQITLYVIKSIPELDDKKILYVGEWDEEVIYASGDRFLSDVVVLYKNSFYRCTSSDTDGKSPDKSDSWTAFSMDSRLADCLLDIGANYDNPIYAPKNAIYAECVQQDNGDFMYSGEVGVYSTTLRLSDVAGYYIAIGQVYCKIEEESNLSHLSPYWSWLLAYGSSYYMAGYYNGITLSYSEAIRQEGLSKWDWYSSNGSATATETQRAHAAITGGGNVSDFSYKVWNDLVNKTYAVIRAASGEWITKANDGTAYLTYEKTLMNASDKTLTAARFNALKMNIGARSSTGISDKKSGDVVKGEYFTALTDALNNWIKTLS